MNKSSNIYLFYGEDTYSAAQKCWLWRNEFIKKYGDINYVSFEGNNLTAKNFIEAVDAMPFLSDKKLIIVQNFLRDGSETDQKTITEKLDQIEDCVVVFFENDKPDARTTLYKKLKKAGKIEEFKLLSGSQLLGWIQKMVTQKSCTIELKEAQLLAELVGPNLWQMEQEIEKLCLYAQGKITAEAIEKLVSPNISASVFKLTDEIGQKKAKASLKTFHRLLESGEDLMKTFFMIIRQFRLIIQIQDLLERKTPKTDINKYIKEHPFVINTVSSQAKNFGSPKLQTIYQKLLNIDSNLKNGKIKIATGDNSELRLAIEKLMVEVCK